MAELLKLRQKPLWWRRDHGSYDRGKRQLAGGKKSCSEQSQWEKGISRTQFYNYVVEKIGKNRERIVER